MYDFTIGMLESIVKHGLSWSTAAAVLFLILKQRAMKRKLKRYMPFMFRDEEVNPTYVNNQQIIMENQRRIMERMEIEWSGPESQMTPIQTSSKKSYQLSWRMNLMKNKLMSRKFWMAVVTGLLIVLNDGLDLGLDSETVLGFAGIIATFIIGEAAVDASRNKNNNDATFGDSGPAE